MVGGSNPPGRTVKANGFREACRRLRTDGATLGEIVAATRRPKSSVYFHIQDIKLSEEFREAQYERATKRIIEFNESRRGKSAAGRHPVPFTVWTVPFVELVSHLLFDGEISRNACVYTNRNRMLIQRVARLMRRVYDHQPRELESTPGVYRISYYNVELAAYLQGKADELLQRISIAPQELKLTFLRSFFDDEGSVYFIRRKRLVRGYQHNDSILKLVQQLLKDFSIKSKTDKKYHEIVISGREHLERFSAEINFSPSVAVNPDRKNSIWRRPLEKREILRVALASYRRDVVATRCPSRPISVDDVTMGAPNV
ncbi:hypothetical protein HYZ80_01595 [Candidatus Parcubacteria bacterium]|nr:hypothetical protein [Candidatus Parcubacteria bacterium]